MVAELFDGVLRIVPPRVPNTPSSRTMEAQNRSVAVRTLIMAAMLVAGIVTALAVRGLLSGHMA